MSDEVWLWIYNAALLVFGLCAGYIMGCAFTARVLSKPVLTFEEKIAEVKAKHDANPSPSARNALFVCELVTENIQWHEREACAKLVQEWGEGRHTSMDDYDLCVLLASRIRARGNRARGNQKPPEEADTLLDTKDAP